MGDFTKFDSYKTANVIAQSAEEEGKRKRKQIFENTATIISLFSIGLTATLYSYNSGYGKVYNIPVNSLPLDLKRFIPLACYIISILFWIIYVIVETKTERLLKINKFNCVRTLYSLYICNISFSAIHLEFYINKVLCMVIALALACAFEGVLIYIRKPKKNKKISEVEYKMGVEDNVHNRLLFSYYIKTGLFCLVIAVTIAPFFGKLQANTRVDYPIFENDGKTYAVIVENDNCFIVQKAIIEGTTLKINNILYEYCQKESIELRFYHFDTVIIKPYFELGENDFYSL